MPVTNYYTVDGQMIGYKDAGGRKDFLTDALGSVTAEVDQTGATKTFDGRYKPYGGDLSSSGTRGSYGWVGTWGYRGPGLSAASHYVRARHYSKNSGNWNTTDQIWPIEHSYCYVNGRPNLLIDPDGLCSITLGKGKAVFGKETCIASCSSGSQSSECTYYMHGRAGIDWDSKCPDCVLYQWWTTNQDGKFWVKDDVYGWPIGSTRPYPIKPFIDEPGINGQISGCRDLVYDKAFTTCISCLGACRCFTWYLSLKAICCEKPVCHPDKITDMVELPAEEAAKWCRKARGK